MTKPHPEAAGLDPDPHRQLALWYAEAQARGLSQPEAAALATASPDGAPSVRMVLYRGTREGELRFFTNYGSRKARELDANPRAALLFFWEPLHRQVRVEGAVARASAAESDEYFASRERSSQIGAWASRQSEPLASREALMRQVAELEKRFEGKPVPRPEYWGGYRLRPDSFEFWIGADHRLHDRFLYRRESPGGPWRISRLSP
jgi:pyridoxamine 5'-phosphate oxidase